MTVTTLYYSGSTRDKINAAISSLDPTKTHRIRIDEFDERTLEQNAKIHVMLSEIAEQMTHLTKKLDLDSWKRLTIAQFRADSIENAVPRLAQYWSDKQMRLIPSLDGSSLVMLGDQTRTFPKYVASCFVEWLNYFGAVNGVRFSAKGEV